MHREGAVDLSIKDPTNESLETSVALLDCNLESCNLYDLYISPRRD